VSASFVNVFGAEKTRADGRKVKTCGPHVAGCEVEQTAGSGNYSTCSCENCEEGDLPKFCEKAWRCTSSEKRDKLQKLIGYECK